MSVVLVGGMDRLGNQYRKVAKRMGMELRIFNQSENDLDGKIGRAEAVVIFTNKVSHQARNQAVSAAKRRGIPLFMHHGCGVCTLRECLKCLVINDPNLAHLDLEQRVFSAGAGKE